MAERFRTKLVEIDAMEYRGGMDSRDEIVAWADGVVGEDHGRLFVETLEGVMRCDVGDWVIKGLKGEFYPCKPDIFELKYEAV